MDNSRQLVKTIPPADNVNDVLRTRCHDRLQRPAPIRRPFGCYWQVPGLLFIDDRQRSLNIHVPSRFVHFSRSEETRFLDLIE